MLGVVRKLAKLANLTRAAPVRVGTKDGTPYPKRKKDAAPAEAETGAVDAIVELRKLVGEPNVIPLRRRHGVSQQPGVEDLT